MLTTIARHASILPQRACASHFFRTAKTLTLRPYQNQCIDNCLTAVQDGKHRLAVSLATGGGKTVIFSHLIDKLQLADTSRSQTLILVHRRELVEQAANHCRKTCVGSTVELEMGIHEASGTADVTVCSLMSLQKRLHKYDPRRVKLIVIDEAHHAAAKTYLNVLDYFGATKEVSDCVVVGFSATLFRKDGLQLGAVFDEIVFHKDYMSMMRDKYLCPAKFTSVKLEEVSLKGIKLAGTDGDFALGQLASRVNTTAANNAAVRAWLHRAKDRKSTIAFAVDIQHVHDLVNCFRAHGVDARGVTSTNDKRERGNLVESFRAGSFPVLVNCGILTEGFDSPNIDCVLLDRPTKSVGLLVQMIGRGLRLAEGKKDCHILDMTSCLDVGVASVPTLFGLDPNELRDQDLTIDELQKRAEKKLALDREPDLTTEMQAGLITTPTSVTYLDYDDMEDLMRDYDAKGVQHISRLSRLSWVQIDATKFILALGNYGFIRIIQNEQSGSSEGISWTGTFTRKLPREADARLSVPKVLFNDVESIEHAVAACDTAALNIAPHTLVSRMAGWRKEEATGPQKAYMKKLGSQLIASGRPITRGQAQDFITRCIHGGKATIDRENKERKAAFKSQLRDFKHQENDALKRAKEAEKEARRNRVVVPEVNIGPIQQAS